VRCEFANSIPFVTFSMIRKTVLQSSTLLPLSSASCSARHFPSFFREATLGANRGHRQFRVQPLPRARSRQNEPNSEPQPRRLVVACDLRLRAQRESHCATGQTEPSVYVAPDNSAGRFPRRGVFVAGTSLGNYGLASRARIQLPLPRALHRYYTTSRALRTSNRCDDGTVASCRRSLNSNCEIFFRCPFAASDWKLEHESLVAEGNGLRPTAWVSVPVRHETGAPPILSVQRSVKRCGHRETFLEGAVSLRFLAEGRGAGAPCHGQLGLVAHADERPPDADRILGLRKPFRPASQDFLMRRHADAPDVGLLVTEALLEGVEVELSRCTRSRFGATVGIGAGLARRPRLGSAGNASQSLFDRRSILQKHHDKSLFHLRRVEPEWPASALERDFAVAIDDVESVRHAAVGVAHAVVDAVDQDGHAHFEQIVALRGHFDPLKVGFRLGRGDAHAIVRFHPPAFDRMRFADIHGQELGPIAVFVAQIIEGPKLGPERPSREAAEDQDDGLFSTIISQRDPSCLVVRLQGECRPLLTQTRAFKA
jgi:hypothetical protein